MMNQMPYGMPNQNFMPMPEQNNALLEQKLNQLEQYIRNIEMRLKTIEKKMNIDNNSNVSFSNSSGYQSSMYMM